MRQSLLVPKQVYSSGLVLKKLTTNSHLERGKDVYQTSANFFKTEPNSRHFTINLTLIILLFLNCIALQAQRFDGGIVAGLSAGQIDGDTYAGFHKGGLTAGAFAETELSDDFFMRFEIKYTGKGAAKQDREDNSDFYKRSLHYVELPVILGYSLSKHDISLHGGLSPAYLFHSHQEGTDLATGEVPGYRDFDLGWLLGAGYAFNRTFSAEIRYTYSLIRISELSRAGEQYSWLARQLGYNVGDYNNVVTVSLYYRLGRK